MTAIVYSNPPPHSPAAHTSLLVLDPYPLIARIFEKVLKNKFDRVLSAAGTAEANQILKNEIISHLVISTTFSKDTPVVELVSTWKKQYPQIVRTILFTAGSYREFLDRAVFDAVLKKPADAKEMLQVVLGKPSQ